MAWRRAQSNRSPRISRQMPEREGVRSQLRHESRYPGAGFNGCAGNGARSPAREDWSMRSALVLLVLPALVSSAYAADVKGASRVDAVTVFPSGAEITRLGKVRLERGDHVILFTDLPARAIHNSIRV